MEFGIETKALLYKRMCAYAGLHAIVIKGFCKVTSSNVKGKNVCVNGFLVTQAKEYKPSEEFVDNRWRNAWNAVYVAGGWRLVQPNWAAMQVQTKVGTWGHNVNCNCDGNQSGNSKCKNNGGHNGRANGN